MPVDVQVAIQGASLLPEDRFINTLHFTGPDTFGSDEADELWSKYDAFMTVAMGGYAATGHSVSVYDPGPNPGGPKFRKEYTRGAQSANSAPSEVAICLSYATVDDPDASLPRRRGRIFLGPLATSVANDSRPGASLRDAVLDLGEGIATVGTALGVTWAMYSKLDNAYAKIESIWVDDAWDTQRRRGLKPTLREVRDVQ